MHAHKEITKFSDKREIVHLSIKRQSMFLLRLVKKDVECKYVIEVPSRYVHQFDNLHICALRLK